MMQKWQGRQQARIKSCLQWVQIVHSLSSLNTFHEEFSSSFKKILTQMEMSCCSVAIKLGVQPYIFAVHLKTFRVGVYRVLMFSLSVFFVTFLETYSCYIWKHTGLTLMISFSQGFVFISLNPLSNSYPLQAFRSFWTVGYCIHGPADH